MSDSDTPYILSLETATYNGGSVAVCEGARTVASRVFEAQSAHSTHLLRYVEEILNESGISLRQVDLFATSLGPGSFTGLRIGLATVKAFAATLVRPSAGVPTLHAVAHAAGASRQTLAVLPAGRGEVFAQLLSVGEDKAVRALAPPVHVAPPKLFSDACRIRQLKLAGEGAHLHIEIIKACAATEGIRFAAAAENSAPISTDEGEGLWVLAPHHEALAVAVAHLAMLSFAAGETSSADNLRAIYVRAADAELKRSDV